MTESIEKEMMSDKNQFRESETGKDNSSKKKRTRKRTNALQCKYCSKVYYTEAFFHKHVRAHGKYFETNFIYTYAQFTQNLSLRTGWKSVA